MKSILGRMGLIQLGVLALLAVLYLLLLDQVLLPGFAGLERQQARRDLERACGLIDNEVDHLATTCLDWSSWDDTYQFAVDRNAAYEKSNLAFSTFSSNHWNMMMILAPSGRVVWSRFYDLDQEEALRPADLDVGRLPVGHPFLLPHVTGVALETQKRAGLVTTAIGPMLVASRPILHSDGSGPAHGFLVIGRLLNEHLQKDFAGEARVALRFEPPALFRGDGTAADTVHLQAGPEFIQASSLLKDLGGMPLLTVTATFPREIFRKGETALSFSSLALGIGALALILASILMLHQQVARPLARLAAHSRRIGETGDLSARLQLPREDEIGVLATALDAMVAALGGKDAQLRALHAEQQRELTERLAIEARLRHSEEKLQLAKRMESVGLLAGGVAHDLNNMLAAIVSYPDLLLHNEHLSDQQRLFVRQMQASGLRIAAIVKDLLTLTKGTARVCEVLSLNGLIEDFLDTPEMAQLVHYHPQVVFGTALAADLKPLCGSDPHLRKAIFNLLSNAAEAIVGAGRVEVSTRNVRLLRPLPGYDTVVRGEYLQLRVKDDGPGISAADLPRIFEPFFTKKVFGRSGTGLGLAVVWNTIQEHQGYIQVRSSATGTTFAIYLPAVLEVSPEPTAAVPVTPVTGHGERILVVDDVEVQRQVFADLLTGLGYRVETVANGEQALERLRTFDPELMIIDMLMEPGLNGLETYRQVIARRPGQKALIASGFSATQAVNDCLALGASAFLAKPVTLDRLARAVRTALDGTPAPPDA